MREATVTGTTFLHRKYVAATRVKNENNNNKIKVNHTCGIFTR